MDTKLRLVTPLVLSPKDRGFIGPKYFKQPTTNQKVRSTSTLWRTSAMGQSIYLYCSIIMSNQKAVQKELIQLLQAPKMLLEYKTHFWSVSELHKQLILCAIASRNSRDATLVSYFSARQ